MIGHWIAFGLFFPVTFFGVIGFKEWTKKFLKTEITPEMKRAANKKVALLILLYWLCDLFYMACFIDNLVCQYHDCFLSVREFCLLTPLMIEKLTVADQKADPSITQPAVATGLFWRFWG